MIARLPLGLFAVALSLATVVAYQTLAPVSGIKPLAPSAAVPRPHPVAVIAPYAPPPESQFAIINQRPLFDPARQPVSEPGQSGTSSGSPPDFSLVGVAIGPWSSVALLKKTGAPSAITARLGDTIDGWQIVGIKRDGVIFHAGATEFTLKFKAASAEPAPAIGAPPASEQPAPPQPAPASPPVQRAPPRVPPPIMTGARSIAGQPLPQPGQYVGSDGKPVTRTPPKFVGPNK